MTPLVDEYISETDIPLSPEDYLLVASATNKGFCPTGPGGGVDNSCGAGGDKTGWDSVPKYVRADLIAKTQALPPHLKGTVEEYQESGMFAPLNSFLRTGVMDVGDAPEDAFDELNTPEAIGWANMKIGELDEAIAACRLMGNVVVYRGLDKGVVDTIKKGAVLEDKGYVSSSFNQQVAADFAGPDGDLFRISVRHGAKALYADPIVDLEQKELILARGAKFKVTAIRRDSSGRRLVYVDHFE